MSFESASHEPRRLSRDGGFSLIELVAVMVVVGIIAATAVVSLSSMTGNRATMAAKQLQRDLTFARQRAVATGTRSWVEFNDTIPIHTWTVMVEDPGDPGPSGAIVLTDPATHANFVQALGANQFASVQITAVNFDADKWIGFDWLGRPLDQTQTLLGANGFVTLTGGHQVTVEKDTGHIAYVAP